MYDANEDNMYIVFLLIIEYFRSVMNFTGFSVGAATQKISFRK